MHHKGVKVFVVTALIFNMLVLPVLAAEQNNAAEKNNVTAMTTVDQKKVAKKVANDKKSSAKKPSDKKAEADRIAAEKAEADRVAAEKAEADRVAAEKAEDDRIAAEKAERIAATRAASERAAAERAVADGRKLPLAVNSSRILNFNGVERIAVANPEIADVIVISGSEVMVVGKAPGTTTLHIWSWAGRQTYTVEVAADDVPIASEIKRVVGLSDISVTKAGKTVILEGKTNDNYQRQRAEKVASAYAEKVVNLLEIADPVVVRIEAKIVELSKSKEDELGVKWGSTNGGTGIFDFGQSSTYANSVWGNSLGKLGTIDNINGALSLLVKNGSAKVLSQPNLSTVSGESANILIGGQIPVPTSSSNGSVTVEWKDYGIKLDITPEVNSEGIISGKVKVEVSTLDTAHEVAISSSISIPAIKTRKAESVIALPSGRTMAIAGLLSRDDEKTIYKLPIIGDLPVIGNLFRSKSFTRDETELVILITPTVVRASEYVPTNGMSSELKDALNNAASTKNSGKKITGKK
ncbi:MAG: type and secretion system protein [Firmicutes bacterium]|nr:type and secretion system protein [Bacillota bacterium]